MMVSFSTAPGASRQLQMKVVCDVTKNVEAVVKWCRKDRPEYCATPRWRWWFDGSQPPRWRWKLDGRNNTTHACHNVHPCLGCIGYNEGVKWGMVEMGTA